MRTNCAVFWRKQVDCPSILGVGGAARWQKLPACPKTPRNLRGPPMISSRMFKVSHDPAVVEKIRDLIGLQSLRPHRLSRREGVRQCRLLGLKVLVLAVIIGIGSTISARSPGIVGNFAPLTGPSKTQECDAVDPTPTSPFENVRPDSLSSLWRLRRNTGLKQRRAGAAI